MMVSRLNALRAGLSRGLQRAPSWLNGAVDLFVDAVARPVLYIIGDWRFRIASSEVPVPPPICVPSGRRRILVAPLNYAGQGNAWARAISAHVPEAGAANLTIEYPDDLAFPTDAAVPYLVNRYSREWQIQEVERVAENFTHVLVEAEAAIFGGRFRNRPEREQQFLESRGLSLAYICHGSDIRSPRRHIESTPFSPYRDGDMYVDRLQRRVDRNVALLERSGAPVFVSTPDLIADFPGGFWVPVVVDVQRWTPGSSADDSSHDSAGVPRVLHTPSRLAVKGSHLIRDAVERVSRRGVIQYSEISGVVSTQIREEVFRADIVLDQFRLGSYGAAACEAMAAGKVVVGHVTDHVRAVVLATTGLELPIVEATPATIEDVLSELAADPARMTSLSSAGREFVCLVHDGRFSASVLDQHWLSDGVTSS